ncbi:MAG: NAD(+)/NADH kinase [Spirochaetaceae bacterium]|nr:NAD(+)/NADH kinase [Spirochaetaceae bacterium]
MAGRKVLIIANLMKDDAAGVAKEMASHLATLGVDAEIYAFSGPPGPYPSTEGLDLVVSLGGDGTVLFAARTAASAGIPIMPFNLGRLGFIAGFGKSDWMVALDFWMAGRIGLTARSMLAVDVRRGGAVIASFIALNDGVVSAQGIAKVIGLDIRVGGSNLGSYRSDGVIVATPTGSTAYNLAAGGPVLHPEMDAMILNPVCPFTLSNRPLVVTGGERIDVLVEEGKRTAVMLTIDGQVTFDLLPKDRVSFTHAERRALIYTPERLAFYEVLREKLSWSGGPNA